MASIVNNIMAEVEARLNTIPNLAEDVYRPTKNGDFLIVNRAIVLTHEDIESDDELSCPGNPPKTAWVLPVRVVCIVVPDDDATASLDIGENDFGVEAMDAITTPQASWHQFDGNAVNATLTPLVNFHPGDDTARAVLFTIRVTYRVDETSQATL